MSCFENQWGSRNRSVSGRGKAAGGCGHSQWQWPPLCHRASMNLHRFPTPTASPDPGPKRGHKNSFVPDGWFLRSKKEQTFYLRQELIRKFWADTEDTRNNLADNVFFLLWILLLFYQGNKEIVACFKSSSSHRTLSYSLLCVMHQIHPWLI